MSRLGDAAGKWLGRARARDGQSTVFVALLIVPLCLFAGLAVDGGYAMVQLRQAQNASDFASSGAVYALEGVCGGQGSETNLAVTGVIDDLVQANAQDAVGAWQAVYLNASGQTVTGAPALPDASGYAPAGACGVRVEASPKWPTFFLSLIGMPSLTASAEAGAIWGNSPVGSPAGSPGTAQGVPVVGASGYTPTGPSGDTSAGGGSGPTGAGFGVGIVALAPLGMHTIYGGGAGQFIVNGDIMDNSTGSPNSQTGYADTVDNFQSSSTVINGHLYSVAQEPLDPCFAPAGATVATCTRHTSGSITYTDGIVGGLAAMPDPLAYVAVPSAQSAACSPAQSAAVDPAPVGGVYFPGVYDYRLTITSSATLSDCAGSPGIYIFEQGVAICPAAGQSVVGHDVMLYSESGSGSGSGAPGPGPGGPGGPGGTASTCGSPTGPGASDGVQLGGQGTITLSGPASGVFSHLVLYQARAGPANIGLDDSASDSASIAITGAIYDNSDPTGTNGGAGVLMSGQRQTGRPGATSGSGGGAIAIDGMVVVDQFSTAGSANLTITYDPSQVPDAGPVLVQ